MSSFESQVEKLKIEKRTAKQLEAQRQAEAVEQANKQRAENAQLVQRWREAARLAVQHDISPERYITRGGVYRPERVYQRRSLFLPSKRIVIPASVPENVHKAWEIFSKHRKEVTGSQLVSYGSGIYEDEITTYRDGYHLLDNGMVGIESRKVPCSIRANQGSEEIQYVPGRITSPEELDASNDMFHGLAKFVVDHGLM